MRQFWAAVVLFLTLATPTVASAADACGGISFSDGRIRLGTTLAIAEKGESRQDEACLDALASAIKGRPWIRSLTILARAPDDNPARLHALAAAGNLLEALERRGVSRALLSAVAPRGSDNQSPALHLAYTERSNRRVVARLDAVQGTAKAGLEPGTLTPVQTGSQLREFDYLEVADGGFALMRLADESSLRVEGGSSVRLLHVSITKKLRRKVHIELVRGEVETHAQPQAKPAPFEVRTRSAVAGVRGTDFRVALGDKDSTRLSTLEGKVNLRGDAGEVDVNQAMRSLVYPGQAPEAPKPLLVAPRVLAPIEGQVKASSSMRWEPVKGASSYRIVFGNSPKLVADRVVARSEGTELRLPPLAPGQKWFFRIAAIDHDGFEGLPSKIYAFTIAE